MPRHCLTYNPSTSNCAQRGSEPWIDQRTSNNIRFTFSGKERDDETGYNYFGARYYNSDISIWLSVDPMASERAWLTPYNYVQNNPLKLTDPSGMLDICENCPKNEKFDIYRESAENFTYVSDGNFEGVINAETGESTIALNETTPYESKYYNDIGLALTIRNSVLLPGTDKPNPFYMAEAIQVTAGFDALVMEKSQGGIFLLDGPNVGDFLPIEDIGFGGLSGFNLNASILRIDAYGEPVRRTSFEGERTSFGLGISLPFGLGVGVTGFYSENGPGKIIGYGVQGSFGVNAVLGQFTQGSTTVK